MIRSRYTAAVTDKPWWLAGGIAPSACVAAYQAVRASDYAASKVNLVDGSSLAEKGGAISWTASGGWSFDRTNYLTTSIVPVRSITTIIASYANTEGTSGGYTIIGIKTSNSCTTALAGYWYGDQCYASNGQETGDAPALLSGTLAMSGLDFYRDGIYDSTKDAGSGDHVLPLNIGALTTSINYRMRGNIYAIAIYILPLTASTISELTRAMNAL